MFLLELLFEHPWWTLLFAWVVAYVVMSLHRIGPTEVGLVVKRFG